MEIVFSIVIGIVALSLLWNMLEKFIKEIGTANFLRILAVLLMVGTYIALFASAPRVGLTGSPTIWATLGYILAGALVIAGAVFQFNLFFEVDSEAKFPRRCFVPIGFGILLCLGLFVGLLLAPPSNQVTFKTYLEQAAAFTILSSFKAWMAPTYLASSLAYTLAVACAGQGFHFDPLLEHLVEFIFERTPPWLALTYAIVSHVYLLGSSIFEFNESP